MFPPKICQIKLNKQDISPELKHFYEISVVVDLNCLPYLKTLTSLTVVKSFKVYLGCSIKIQISVLSKNPNLDLNFSPLKYHLYHHDTFPGIFRM